MSWIEPLKMETWIVQVLAGSPEIFTALSLLVIYGMCGYFKMTGFSTFFMVITFMLMFSGIIPYSLIVFVAMFGGLVAGFALSNIAGR